MTTGGRFITAAAVVAIGCGNESGGGGREDGGDASASISVGSLSATGGTADGTAGSATDGHDGSTSGSGSGGGSDADESAGSATLHFDLGVPDAGTACPEGTGGAVEHSYIWIANSGQGTVSKINTQTLVEEGRYIVRPDSAGNPSRTSVSLTGNVAVANRSGGVIKIFANPDDCQESNGMPGIQTSGDANALAWGTEECVAWYTPFNYTTQRPVAWAAGDWNDALCTYQNEKLWTAGGMNAGTADVLLLDGETGVVEDMVSIPNVIGWAQLYGGAVDPDGDFWTVDHNWDGASTLIRVNRQSMTYDSWPVTGQVHYGLAVDKVGRAWLCGSGGASRFDPVSESWTHLAPINGGSALGGCMEDADGILWHSAYPNASLVGIDTETVQIVQQLAIPEYVHGISIDFDGYVWGVAFAGSNAYRVDVATGTVDTVGGLVGAYTYSDMTGFALSSVGAPSG
ncbi:MAG: hypothetical protein K1X88_31980 [Nannocystaceae bacterium]|nr:hypothetical protein [Nannocystaceae bacterium]